LSWLAVLPGLPFNFRHGLLLWKVRLVGEMLNTVTPVVGVGGEPVKAWILIRRFGLAPRETIASVLVAKTTILLSYIPFLAIGFALMFGTVPLPGDYVGTAGAGLAIYTIAIVAFFLVQRYRLASRLGTRLRCFRLGARLDGLLRDVHGVDNELERLYVVAPRRLWCSLALAFLGWVLGALELFVISTVLGYPMALTTIWTIEAVVQLLRQASGFVPGSLGVTEGTMMLMYGSLIGDPSVGVAVALVRRAPSRAFGIAALLLVAQIGLGILNVWAGKHAGLILGHLALGTVLWSTVVYAGATLLPASAPASERVRDRGVAGAVTA